MLVLPCFSRFRAAFPVAALIVGAHHGADALSSSIVQDAATSPVVPDLATVTGWIEDARYDAALSAIESAIAACGAGAESERAAWRQLRSRSLRLASRAGDPLALTDALFAADVARSAGDAQRTASALFDLGALHLVRDEVDAAIPALEESLEACVSIGTAADAQRADVWIYLAECALIRGDRDRAEEWLSRAAAIHACALDPEDPRVAFRLVREANLAHRTDDSERAVEIGLRALAAFRARLRPDHPRIALALHNLGTYRQRLGDLPAAARAFEDALVVWRSEHSPQAGRTLMLLAQVREHLGDGEAADRLHDESIAWIERTSGPDASTLRVPLRALALSALRERDLDAAERHVKRALELFRPDEHTSDEERATLEGLLGHVAWQRGQHETAVEVWRAALASLEAGDGAECDAAADLFCDLGLAHAASGSSIEAEVGATLLERALSIRRKIVGSAHPDLAFTLTSFAETAHAAGRGDDAFKAALEAAAIVRRHVDASTLRLDERDALGYATELTPGLPLAVVLAAESPSKRAIAAWDALIASRAAVFEAVRQNRAETRTESGGPSSESRASCANKTMGVAEMARAREDGVAVIAYVRCARPDAYVAFVLASGSDEPHAIDLGSAAEIDRIAAPVCALARSAGSESAWRATAAPLRARVWDPIASFLAGAREVHIVPDGALLLIDFAGLPVGANQYLIETAPPIHVLCAERDVATARAKGPMRAARSASVLAVGGPDYGTAPATEVADPLDRRSPLAVFRPLAHSAAEARDVAKSWSEQGSTVRVLAGSEATESAFREALVGVGIVHVATHGFSESTSVADGGRGLASNPLAPTRLEMRLRLSRRHVGTSGLALAGANERRGADRDDDGVLLDVDVLALDLRGLDLAILSACDSGAGEVQSGEGIFGLRRAFSMAGARAVVGSSWPVADETARTIMTDFHARLARGGTTVARALHEAKLAELTRRRAARLDAHPWHWAGFSAAGEPLRTQ